MSEIRPDAFDDSEQPTPETVLREAHRAIQQSDQMRATLLRQIGEMDVMERDLSAMAADPRLSKAERREFTEAARDLREKRADLRAALKDNEETLRVLQSDIDAFHAEQQT